MSPTNLDIKLRDECDLLTKRVLVDDKSVMSNKMNHILHIATIFPPAILLILQLKVKNLHC